MSPHAVNSLVTDLVQMAQAMEKVPQLEHELEVAHGRIATLQESLTVRDDDIFQARSYASTLEQKVHDLEVAKDAAETMFLEADDRTSRALDFIKATFGNAGSLIQALEPVKAQPVPEGLHSEPILHSEPNASHSESNEVAMHAEPIPQVGEVKTIEPDWAQDKVETSLLPPQGQSAADPIPPLPVTTPSAGPQTASVNETVTLEASATGSWASPTPPDTKLQPYLGKNYYDYPAYVSYNAWIDGGGTDWDYNNRREHYRGEA